MVYDLSQCPPLKDQLTIIWDIINFIILTFDKRFGRRMIDYPTLIPNKSPENIGNKAAVLAVYYFCWLCDCVTVKDDCFLVSTGWARIKVITQDNKYKK